MYEALNLSALREGESAYVTEINAGPAMDRRLTDLGLVRGTRAVSYTHLTLPTTP